MAQASWVSWGNQPVWVMVALRRGDAALADPCAGEAVAAFAAFGLGALGGLRLELGDAGAGVLQRLGLGGGDRVGLVDRCGRGLRLRLGGGLRLGFRAGLGLGAGVAGEHRVDLLLGRVVGQLLLGELQARPQGRDVDRHAIVLLGRGRRRGRVVGVRLVGLGEIAGEDALLHAGARGSGGSGRGGDVDECLANLDGLAEGDVDLAVRSERDAVGAALAVVGDDLVGIEADVPGPPPVGAGVLLSPGDERVGDAVDADGGGCGIRGHGAPGSA
jgi:hypothetical protein